MEDAKGVIIDLFNDKKKDPRSFQTGTLETFIEDRAPSELRSPVSTENIIFSPLKSSCLVGIFSTDVTFHFLTKK